MKKYIFFVVVHFFLLGALMSPLSARGALGGTRQAVGVDTTGFQMKFANIEGQLNIARNLSGETQRRAFHQIKVQVDAFGVRSARPEWAQDFDREYSQVMGVKVVPAEPVKAIVQKEEASAPAVVAPEQVQEDVLSAPKTPEEVKGYIPTVISRANTLSKEKDFFSKLGYPYETADGFWIAYQEAPIEALKQRADMHASLARPVQSRIGSSALFKGKSGEEIALLFAEADEQQLQRKVGNEVSYWLLFVLFHATPPAEQTAEQSARYIIDLAMKLFSLNFNDNRLKVLGQKLTQTETAVLDAVGGEEAFRKIFSPEEGERPAVTLVREGARLKTLVSPEQFEALSPLLEQLSIIDVALNSTHDDLTGTYTKLQESGFIKAAPAPEAVPQAQKEEIVPEKPKKPAGMSLGAKVAVGLVVAIGVGALFLMYKNKDESIPDALKRLLASLTDFGSKLPGRLSTGAKEAGSVVKEAYTTATGNAVGLFEAVKEKVTGKKVEGV